jgi:hypothetical protein
MMCARIFTFVVSVASWFQGIGPDSFRKKPVVRKGSRLSKMKISDWLRAEKRRIAQRPTMKELRKCLRQREPATLVESAADAMPGSSIGYSGATGDGGT